MAQLDSKIYTHTKHSQHNLIYNKKLYSSVLEVRIGISKTQVEHKYIYSQLFVLFGINIFIVKAINFLIV